MAVEIGVFHQTAFGSDVELAQLGGNQGHGGGQCDVPGQHGFVHLGPERVAVRPLDIGIGDGGLQDVGNHIEQQQQR